VELGRVFVKINYGIGTTCYFRIEGVLFYMMFTRRGRILLYVAQVHENEAEENIPNIL
jgi:hypothetical protein